MLSNTSLKLSANGMSMQTAILVLDVQQDLCEGQSALRGAL